ncbi:cytochrome P460 family protein [Lysobacter silvisoli]|uniref:Cytochrome C oxidase subunit III n=1 Tax=Lysobacter silvisoli TaxID=2293254 RepID=A0A371K043_9GAMM|nr:cytochrome P460 family protein [Lysobacter silvisoli]RDZ27289.1 cytochrome C oxidase subunit III [Lysobacter silvisoli]
MNRLHYLLPAAAAAALVLAVLACRYDGRSDERPGPVAPIYGVGLPEGYPEWPLVAPAQEAAPLDELRAVVANEVAIRAYRQGVRPFPDGSVLVKRAWKHLPSPDFAPASIPGQATTVQVMVKDARRYAATGGWGYARFIDGRPADAVQHRTCHACHASRVRDRDYVFTRLAP